MTPGAYLRKLREEHARPLTLGQISRSLGVSKSMLSRYERDEFRPPMRVLLYYVDRFDGDLRKVCEMIGGRR